MARIINIETSSYVCSVAFSIDGNVKMIKENNTDKSHASVLTVFIEQILSELHMIPSNIDAVAVSKGPGSYTGLRIGVSAAKGICYGLSVPLISVCSLQSMAVGILSHTKVSGLINSFNETILLCPMIDARRMEVYTALYSSQAVQLNDISASIIDESSYQEELETNKIIFFGNGAFKCRQVIHHPNAVFIEDFEPSARYMTSLAEDAFCMKNFENTAYFEPFYLKDFIPTVPKNNIISPRLS